MSKIKSNIQAELKGFSKIFESLIRRHNQYKVFDDFLDMFINGFCFDYRINLKNLQSIYTQEERNTFGKLILETLNILRFGHAKRENYATRFNETRVLDRCTKVFQFPKGDPEYFFKNRLKNK